MCAEYGKATGVEVGVYRRHIKRAKADIADVVIMDTAG